MEDLVAEGAGEGGAGELGRNQEEPAPALHKGAKGILCFRLHGLAQPQDDPTLLQAALQDGPVVQVAGRGLVEDMGPHSQLLEYSVEHLGQFLLLARRVLPSQEDQDRRRLRDQKGPHIERLFAEDHPAFGAAHAQETSVAIRCRRLEKALEHPRGFLAGLRDHGYFQDGLQLRQGAHHQVGGFHLALDQRPDGNGPVQRHRDGRPAALVPRHLKGDLVVGIAAHHPEGDRVLPSIRLSGGTLAEFQEELDFLAGFRLRAQLQPRREVLLRTGTEGEGRGQGELIAGR